MAAQSAEDDRMQKIVSLCKRRGFVFQSSEIYGGLRSAYDYGPMGVELKRNLMEEWWKAMVHRREDIVGIDASIIMHPKVWQASGHLANFADPLVDCKVCGDRFRADKAPRVSPGEPVTITLADKGRAKAVLEKVQALQPDIRREGKTLVGAKAGDAGYVCPVCSSPFLSDERQFNMMFRTSLGPVDPVGEMIDVVRKAVADDAPEDELRRRVEASLSTSAVYLRPETAQAMFVNFLNVQQALGLKVPFGIAQMGKSFRNEVKVEHFIFRSCEFEQMEMEYFVKPGAGPEALEYWKTERMNWWKGVGLKAENLRFRAHDADELAHYSDGCYDVEYKFPWGWDELEGIASRTDYDLSAHSEASGKKLSFFDQPNNERYIPHVVEPAAGATRGLLAVLCDAYDEEPADADGKGRAPCCACTRGWPRSRSRSCPWSRRTGCRRSPARSSTASSRPGSTRNTTSSTRSAAGTPATTRSGRRTRSPSTRTPSPTTPSPSANATIAARTAFRSVPPSRSSPKPSTRLSSPWRNCRTRITPPSTTMAALLVSYLRPVNALLAPCHGRR